MTESYIQSKIVKIVKEYGGLAIKLHPFTMAGLPDLMILYKGRCYFIEVKKPGGKVSKIQAAVHKKFLAVGFPVYVHDNYDRVRILLDNHH